MRSVFLAGLLLIALFLISNPASAQSDSVQLKAIRKAAGNDAQFVNSRLWAIKFSPQHLLIDGYYLEVEKHVSAASNHSFIISPQFYSGKTKTVDKLSGRESSYEAARFNGFGTQIMHRIYRADPIKPGRKQYLAYGFNLHRFTVDYAVLGWGEVVGNDGLRYYRYIWHPKQDKIKRVGGVVMFGAQNPIFNSRFITDLYGGIGLRSGSSSDSAVNRFQENILDYGSSGIYLAMGLKLGYTF